MAKKMKKYERNENESGGEKRNNQPMKTDGEERKPK
jgi:hypothetical protein